jgi:hypothetical protein
MIARMLSAVAVLLLIGGCAGPNVLPEGKVVADKAATNPIPRVAEPPVIDGLLNDSAWRDATAYDSLMLNDGSAPTVATRTLLTHDGSNLYVAVVCYEPRTADLRTRITEPDGNVWEDDSVEVYLDPGLRRQFKQYFSFIVNPANVGFDRTDNLGWDGKWQHATTVRDGKAWVIELAVPFETIGLTGKAGEKLGLQIARNRRLKLAKGEFAYLVPCEHEAKDATLYVALKLE